MDWPIFVDSTSYFIEAPPKLVNKLWDLMESLNQRKTCKRRWKLSENSIYDFAMLKQTLAILTV